MTSFVHFPESFPGDQVIFRSSALSDLTELQESPSFSRPIPSPRILILNLLLLWKLLFLRLLLGAHLPAPSFLHCLVLHSSAVPGCDFEGSGEACAQDMELSPSSVQQSRTQQSQLVAVKSELWPSSWTEGAGIPA